MAIDALSFNHENEQFTEECITRELNKAYVGFVSPSASFPIATGNWGCGAFKGSTALKAIIQLMVAAEVGRDLYYYTWGDEKLSADLSRFFNSMKALGVSVGKNRAVFMHILTIDQVI